LSLTKHFLEKSVAKKQPLKTTFKKGSSEADWAKIKKLIKKNKK
jgi:hypothetical protein